MVNQLLVTLVDSVLGAGKNTSKNNRAYHCPFCKQWRKLPKFCLMDIPQATKVL